MDVEVWRRFITTVNAGVDKQTKLSVSARSLDHWRVLTRQFGGFFDISSSSPFTQGAAMDVGSNYLLDIPLSYCNYTTCEHIH